MPLLKLLALDQEDLQVVSSHLQDAVLRAGDMAYLPSQKRFAAILNRFDWESAAATAAKDAKDYERRRTALRFERVLAAKHKGLKPEQPDRVLSLLAIQFDAGDAPSGTVTLTFSGDVTIRLEVECVEAELRDLGPSWATQKKPEHPGEGVADPESSGASGG